MNDRSQTGAAAAIDAEPHGPHTAASPAAAWAAFRAWVDAAGAAGRVVLQVWVHAVSPGRYELRHAEDRDVPLAALEVLRDPEAARRLAAARADGAYRPLRTAPDLRRGWALRDLDATGLQIALERLYPAAVPHWYAAQRGALTVTSWAETAARQSGIYAKVKLVPREALPAAVWACCANDVCLRQVAWGLEPGAPPALAEPVVGEAAVPCPEPCSLFVSFARQVLRFERAPRTVVPGLGAVGEEEAADLRAALAQALGQATPPREGEFEAPGNRRRLRYLAARLGVVALPAPR